MLFRVHAGCSIKYFTAVRTSCTGLLQLTWVSKSTRGETLILHMWSYIKIKNTYIIWTRIIIKK